MEHNKKIILGVLGLLVLSMVSPASGTIVDQIVSPMITTICKIYCVINSIAGGLAALVITISGLKWVGSAEDPGVRKQAKDTIIHALIGMLIIIIATNLVELITGSTGCGSCTTT